MRAEVIAIGDELITGQRLDTNSQWLSERLTEIGVEVAFHTTVGDTLADNVSAFAAAMSRAEVVVVTGGLGPTADDLTREALARALGVGLVRDEASLEHIRQLFAGRGRAMPEKNAVQADFPVGATAIHNQFGTAPGIQRRVQRTSGVDCLVFALPGVPAEMKPMWHESVAPAIMAERGESCVIRHRRIKCFGVGESQLEAMLPDLIRRGREPSVGITVSDATITLRITAAGADAAQCDAAMGPTEALVRETLGDIVFGEEEDELEDVVRRLLRDRGQTVAVAEWATGGLVSEWLAKSLKGEPVLAGGFVVSGVGQIERLLGASGLDAASPDASALSVAAAEGVRKLTDAHFGLGIAAFPAAPDEPGAHVYISIATPERTRRLRFGCAAHPAIRQARTAKQALNALRLTLLGRDSGDLLGRG